MTWSLFSPFAGDFKETFMLHKSPSQHCTTSSAVGGLLQYKDPSSLATMQPFWRRDVPFTIEREVKHCGPKHRSPLMQDVPWQTHSDILALASPVLKKKMKLCKGQITPLETALKDSFLFCRASIVLWKLTVSVYPSFQNACRCI